MCASIPTMELERIADVWIAHLRSGSLDDLWVDTLGKELIALIEQQGCRKLVLHFGELDCLYSMLLGKLVMIRRRMLDVGGRLRLYGVSPLVHDVFRVCRLESFFQFCSDRETALASW